MRRQQFKIAGLILILVALVAAVVFLKTPPQTEGEEKERDGDVTAQMEDNDANGIHGKLLQSDSVIQITEVSVENDDDSYCIARGEDGYTIREFPEGRLDEDVLTDVLNLLLQVQVSEELGEQEQLEQFGLGTGGTRVHVTDENGADWAFTVGDMLRGNENMCYVLLKEQVYVAEGFPRRLCEGRKAFYKLNLIDVKADKETENVLEYLTIGGTHFEEEICITQSPQSGSGYLMEAPAYGEVMFAETDMAAQRISIPDSLSGVTAEAVIYENADTDERKECGLEEPYAVAEYGIHGERHTIRVSDVCEGRRYMMVDEDPAIYTVEEIRVNAWADASADHLRTAYLWLVDVTGLDRLVIETEGSRYEYRIERQKQDGDETLRVYYEDKELDADGVWLPFYQQLLGMPVLSTKKPPAWEEKPEYTITYYNSGQNGKEPVVIELCREPDSGRYVALLNGRFAGVLREDTVKAVMESVDKVNRDGDKR